jgi:hypothetical protein
MSSKIPTEEAVQPSNGREEQSLDPGLYVNLFEVDFDDREVNLMCVGRSQYPKLKPLRDQLSESGINAQVYAAGGTIYGYGPSQEQLEEFGFIQDTVIVGEVPQLASRMILEGYVKSLEQAKYTCWWNYGRAMAYYFDKPLIETETGVKLYRGFELQSMYLFNPETESLVYCISINAGFKYRDAQNNPLNTRTVKAKFGSETLKKLRIKQGDLAPMGKINLEVSRQRLTELIIPFVKARHEFVLPCGIPAELSMTPIRVVLSAEEQQ